MSELEYFPHQESAIFPHPHHPREEFHPHILRGRPRRQNPRTDSIGSELRTNKQTRTTSFSDEISEI